MMLLSHDEIIELIRNGVIENAEEDCVNSSSLDIHLGAEILVEVMPFVADLSLAHRESLTTVSVDIGRYFKLTPGQFILAHSREIFHLPNNISAEYKLKSSMARIGLEHLNAGWCDAGWNGSVLTLELKNMTQFHNICLEKDVKIGQIVFFKHTPVPQDKSYSIRGRYNGDKSVSGAKS